MKRFVSIWLPTLAIDRMRRQQAFRVPRDKPFALVESGARGVAITAVNRPAVRGGVMPGQMLADARTVLPGLLTSPAEPERDAQLLHQLALWLGRYGPQRNVEGDDGLWVDITGVAHLFGGEAGLAHDCIRRFGRAGFNVRLGVADTRSSAFALARFGQGQGGSGESDGAASSRANSDRHQMRFTIAPAGDTRKALAGLPVEGLQLAPDLVILLRRLGLKRIGQLYGLPRAALARRFRDAAPKTARSRRHSRLPVRAASPGNGWAEALVMRLDQALGELSEPQRGIKEPPLYRVQRSYSEPLISHDGILSALDDLVGQLCVTLDQRDEGARVLRFTIYRADGTAGEMNVRTSRPARAADHITFLFNVRLENIDAGLGVDAVVLEALQTAPLAREQAGFTGAGETADGDPAVLVDRLMNRLGGDAVFYLDEASSHIPERAGHRHPALKGAPRRRSKGAVDGDQIASAVRLQPVGLCRPAFLLDPAEIITVLAEVPDGPPVRFTWRRVMRRVIRAEGPERIAPEWWRWINYGAMAGVGGSLSANTQGASTGGGAPANTHTGLAGGGVPVNMHTRDYYRVEDEHGGAYWIYRAGLYPDADRDQPDEAVSGHVPAMSAPPVWYMQGLF